MKLSPTPVVGSEGEARDRLHLVLRSDPLRSGERLAGRSAIDRCPGAAGKDNSSASVGAGRQNGQQDEQSNSHGHEANVEVWEAPRFDRKYRLSATSAASFEKEPAEQTAPAW
jgi:hypothetical protein